MKDLIKQNAMMVAVNEASIRQSQAVNNFITNPEIIMLCVNNKEIGDMITELAKCNVVLSEAIINYMSYQLQDAED